MRRHGLRNPERKVNMKQFLIGAMLVASSFSAFANTHVQGETGLGWVCGLTFEGTSKGVQFFIGSFQTQATGKISCLNNEGRQEVRPVMITMTNRKFAPAIGAGYFEFKGMSGQISLLNASPDVLFGDYYIAQAQAAWALGASVMTATKLDTPQLAIQIGIQANEGIGLHIGLNKMTISAL